MATKKKPESAAIGSVQAFLDALVHPHREGVMRLRELILSLDPRVREEVKWNAPSFALEDHFATFKLHPPKQIQLVLHTGAKAKDAPRKFTIDDPRGLLRWAAPDRCVLTLASSAEAEAHLDDVASIVRQWIAQLQGGEQTGVVLGR